MIKDLELVALTRSLPPYGLERGDIGTVVMAYDGGRGYSVEFMTLTGETLAIATVDAADVRPLRSREIANARAVASADRKSVV